MKKFLLALIIAISMPSFSTACEVGVEKNCSHGITLYGDLKYPADFKNFDYVNPEAPKTGEIRLAVTNSFDSLNPFVLKGVSAPGVTSVYDSLLTSSADEPFSYYGLLAKAIKKEEGKVTFYLRNEAKFANGEALTAKDVKFTFDTLIEKGHPLYQQYYADIESINIDDNAVTFTLKKGHNRDLPIDIGSQAIFSKKFYTENDFLDSAKILPVGSGAYQVSEFDVGKFIKLKLRDNYWAKDLPVNVGRANFQYMRYDTYRDYTVLVEAIKSGEYDFRQENVSKNWANAYNIDAVKNGELIREEIPHKLPTGMQAFLFNTRNPIFQDIKVRQAIGYAFDFEWINKNIFYDAYSRNDSYFSNSEFASEGKISEDEMALLEQFAEDIPPAVFDSIHVNPKTNGSGKNRKQLRTAKKILQQAGYKLGDDGILAHEKTGLKLEFEIIIRQSVFERVFAPFIQSLEKLGIKATLKKIDTAQFKERTDKYDYDMIVTVLGVGNSPSFEQYSRYHSSQVDIEGGDNLIGVNNPAVDFLVENLVKAENLNDLKLYSQALDRVLLNSYYVVPNWNVRSFRLIYWNKFGKPETRPAYGIGMDTWWIK